MVVMLTLVTSASRAAPSVCSAKALQVMGVGTVVQPVVLSVAEARLGPALKKTSC